MRIGDFRTLDRLVAESMGEARFTSVLGTLFSFLALSLAALGLYGVISYSTSQRSREFGLHLALGAKGRDLFLGVIREGLLLAAAGVGLGLLAAGALTRYLAAVLYEVDPLDPAVFASVAALLIVLGTLSSTGPALRASHVDPMKSLRSEG